MNGYDEHCSETERNRAWWLRDEYLPDEEDDGDDQGWCEGEEERFAMDREYD